MKHHANALTRCPPLAAVALLVLCGASTAQAPADAGGDLQYFVGSWYGTTRGEPGDGMVARHYEPAVGGRYLRVENTATYKPQEKNPKGEVHEDVGYFSFDRARNRFVFRQFHVEGFVNQYVMEPRAAGSKTYVFVSEALENVPPGWRARETYTVHGPDEFTELFELARPGADFQVYSESKLRRKR